MKKIVLVLLILIVSLTAFARPVKRIKFPKGAVKVTVTGYLKNYKDSQTYIIRLRAGQRLKIDSNRSITLFVLNPSGEDVMDRAANCNGVADISPTVAGDYRIEVVECPKADAWKGNFKLYVRVK